MMITFLSAVLLLLLALLALTLEKAYFYLPYRELKRQAAHKDHAAAIIYDAAAYGGELRLFLFTLMGISAAGGFVLFARVAPPVLGFLVVGLVLLLAYVWIPRTHLSSIGAQLAVWCTPAVVHALRFLHPALHKITEMVRGYQAYNHTGVYEREDMVELIEQQKHQGDSRVSEQELELMRNVLRFGEYHVLDIVVPHRLVKAVNIDEDISPVFLAELHESGHPRFPVYEGKHSNIVGTLAIDRVADVRQHGKVRDNFDRHVAYVHEQDSLEQALRAFYETRQHLFIVVNKMNEYVGIVTLSDILHKLFGAIEHEAFGHHEDREAVAKRHDQKPTETKSEENIAENATEVVK